VQALGGLDGLVLGGQEVIVVRRAAIVVSGIPKNKNIFKLLKLPNLATMKSRRIVLQNSLTVVLSPSKK
jgi:hypothetical protein